MKTKHLIRIGTVAALAGAWHFKTRRQVPPGIIPIQPFDAQRYLGKWYEIARLDFRFEKNLIHTSAHYSMLPNGNIQVVNQGYHITKHKWQQATGKAKFMGSPKMASLLVSFFGPFYAGYHVIGLDADYKYALVAGRNFQYLWILSRKKSIPTLYKNQFLKKAAALGFPISKLVWPKQTDDVPRMESHPVSHPTTSACP